MIRTLRLSDVPWQLLPGRLESKDLVSTHVTLQSPRDRLSQIEMARWTMSPSRRREAIGAFEDGRLEAVVVVKARREPTAWEVARLFSSARGYAQLDELVTAGVRAAGRRGADRLFLRSPSMGPACGPAERTGFRRAFTEEVFAGMLSGSSASDLGLRRLQASDIHGVFRLHTAALPASARPAVGMTLDQWTAGREQAVGRAEEFVWDAERGLMAWLCLDRRGDEATIEAVLHPDHSSRAQELVEGAAEIAGRETHVRWIVPSHEPALAKVLDARGWRSDGRYDVYVRPVARRVREPSMVPAQA